MNSLEKQMLKRMVFWTFIGIGLSYGINFVMFTFLGDAAFPWNLIVIIGAFLLLGRFFIRRQMKQAGFGLGSFTMNDKPKISYECRSCHFIYKGEKCWRCGASGGKAVFD